MFLIAMSGSTTEAFDDVGVTVQDRKKKNSTTNKKVSSSSSPQQQQQRPMTAIFRLWKTTHSFLFISVHYKARAINLTAEHPQANVDVVDSRHSYVHTIKIP